MEIFITDVTNYLQQCINILSCRFIFLCYLVTLLLSKPAKSRALCVLALTRLTHHWYAHCPSLICACTSTHLMCLRAFALTNKRRTLLFLSGVVVLIVKYRLRLKNPRKAAGPDFIPLKVIKIASNVIDFHLYNIMIKDLEKNKYSEEQKTAFSLQ